MGHTKGVQNVILVSQNAQFGSKWGLSIRTITSDDLDITISAHLFYFFIENCPKLRASNANFGQTLIFRPKLRFCSLTLETKIKI